MFLDEIQKTSGDNSRISHKTFGKITSQVLPKGTKVCLYFFVSEMQHSYFIHIDFNHFWNSRRESVCQFIQPQKNSKFLHMNVPGAQSGKICVHSVK